MNKNLIKACLFLFTGAILAYITNVILLQLRGIKKFEFLGWLNLVGWGVMPGVVTLGAVLFVITCDVIWGYSLVIWMLQTTLHIKPNDNSLNLP